MDMAEFYKKNEQLCVSDVTSNEIQFSISLDGKKVQIKIQEYDPSVLQKIRRKSGYDDKQMVE